MFFELEEKIMSGTTLDKYEIKNVLVLLLLTLQEYYGGVVRPTEWLPHGQAEVVLDLLPLYPCSV